MVCVFMMQHGMTRPFTKSSVMKIYEKTGFQILSVLLFEAFLLVLTSSAGNILTRLALCSVFFGMGLFILLARPLPSLPISNGIFHLIHFLSYFVMIYGTIRAEDHVATMGVFATVPANIGLLAVLLLEPVARRLKERSSDQPEP